MTIGNRVFIRLYVSCITNIIPHIQRNISILEKSEVANLKVQIIDL